MVRMALKWHFFTQKKSASHISADSEQLEKLWQKRDTYSVPSLHGGFQLIIAIEPHINESNIVDSKCSNNVPETKLRTKGSCSKCWININKCPSHNSDLKCPPLNITYIAVDLPWKVKVTRRNLYWCALWYDQLSFVSSINMLLYLNILNQLLIHCSTAMIILCKHHVLLLRVVNPGVYTVLQLTHWMSCSHSSLRPHARVLWKYPQITGGTEEYKLATWFVSQDSVPSSTNVMVHRNTHYQNVFSCLWKNLAYIVRISGQMYKVNKHTYSAQPYCMYAHTVPWEYLWKALQYSIALLSQTCIPSVSNNRNHFCMLKCGSVNNAVPG